MTTEQQLTLIGEDEVSSWLQEQGYYVHPDYDATTSAVRALSQDHNFQFTMENEMKIEALAKELDNINLQDLERFIEENKNKSIH